jgi:hypothetical protein
MKQEHPGLPVVLLSYSDLVPLNPSFDLVLGKPFSLNELQEAIVICSNLRRYGRFVLVHERGEKFRVQSRAKCVLVDRRDVVNETARTVNMLSNERNKVQLTAPSWIRLELQKRGFEL